MKHSVKAAVLALALALAPSMAQAGGFRVVEVDNAGQGVAHANAASVKDAAALYYNPAAMLEVGSYAAKAGFVFIDPLTEYSGATRAVDTENETYAAPHLYVVKNYEGKGIAVGLGVFTNFAHGSNWSIFGPFRYEATETKITSASYNLSVAKSVGEKFSVAAGVSYIASNSQFDSMYPFETIIGSYAPDGFMKMKADGAGFGFNLAALYKPTEKIRVGLTYRSRTKTKFTGDVDILNFPGALRPTLAAAGVSGADYTSGAEVEIEYPDTITLGVSFDATDKITVEVDADYTGWSSMNELRFKYSKPLSTSAGVALLPSETVEEYNWDNVIAYRVGVKYKCHDRGEFRLGFAIDPTPVPDETFTPRFPGADAKIVSLGYGHRAADNFTIDASFSYGWTDSRSVDNDTGSPFTTVDGDYKTTANVFGVSVGYQF